MRILTGLLAVSLGVGFCFAADQQAKPSERAEDSTKVEKKESRRPHIRFGGVMIGAGYSHGYPWYPYGYGYYPTAWAYPGYLWDPFFSGIWAHPGFYSGFAYGPNMGEVKLETSDKTAAVFIDGGFAGYSGKLKNMWLEPGVYNLEVRSGGQKFEKRVYVLTGKTLKLDARLTNTQREERP